MTSNRRYWVYLKSGRKFLIEEYGDPHTDWGNVNPATKKIEKVAAKNSEIIDDSNTQIKGDQFKTIVMLNAGTSPLAYIDALDKSDVDYFEELDCGQYLKK